MRDLKMNQQLGIKWFTFYTKVRPWFACFSVLAVVVDFIQYADVYVSYWWMLIYLLAGLAHPVLCVMVAIKSFGDYVKFVRFVKFVLLFETIEMAYSQGVNQYIRSEFDFVSSLVVFVIVLIVAFLVWYLLNVKYFVKRINVVTNDVINDEQNMVTDKICFCRNCGEKLIDSSRFCRKCGTKVLDE